MVAVPFQGVFLWFPSTEQWNKKQVVLAEFCASVAVVFPQAGLCPSVPVLCVLPLVPVDRAQTGGRGRCRGSTLQKLILL